MEVPPELLHRAARWGDLKRWERRELGQELRRLGLAYREIGEIIPVPKGTLSGWCRDIPLTPEQLDRIRSLGGNREVRYAKLGALLHQRNLERIAAVREAGRGEAKSLIGDPDWVAGVVAYWAEGAKRHNHLKFSNSDPALIRLFMRWAWRYLDHSIDRYYITIHFHSGQDLDQLTEYWSEVTGIPRERFRKGFMKPEGTGHRKNVLYHGTVQIGLRRSGDLLHRVLGWIDHLAGGYGDLG
ncbi:MAG: hypothetical protein ACRDI1_07425 [Actinomycetota bacterium]